MLIESAFYKLPELLTTGQSREDSSESIVVHFMALALHMELDLRNTRRPFDHICPEMPYPTVKGISQKLRADLYLHLDYELSSGHPVFECYGARQDNWIEAKAYLRQAQHGSTPPKTQNAGRLVRDMLRLTLFLEEAQGGSHTNGRYLLVVAAGEASSYLAFGDRPWLKDLFSEGEAELSIDVGGEQKTFQEAVGAGFLGLAPVSLKLSTRTLMFRPYTGGVHPLYWGYLIRIRDFEVTLPTGSVTYKDEQGDRWDASRVAEFAIIRNQALEAMR